MRSMRLLAWAAALLVAGGGAGIVFGQDAAKGEALLQAARQALGGQEKLRAIRTLDAEGPFKRDAGQTTLEGELRIRLELPDKLRQDEDISLPGGGPAITRTQVLNGTVVWDESSGALAFGPGRRGGIVTRGGAGASDPRRGGPGGFDPAQLEQMRRRAREADLARLKLAWLLIADGSAAWIGTAESPDGRADVLEVAPPNGPRMRLFLDESSHEPLMITWQGPARTLALRRGGGPEPRTQQETGVPAEAMLQITLGEYKAVDGLRLPHFITQAVNGRTIEEWTVDSYRVNRPFAANVFTK